MILGLIKYHLLLLAREPLNIFFGFGLPFLQLLMASSSENGENAYLIERATPMIIILAVMVLCFTDSAYSHAYSRQTKFLRRLRMTPAKPFHYIITGILSRVGVTFLFATSFIGVSVFGFGMDVSSKNWLLFILILLLAFAMFYLIAMFVANIWRNAKSTQGLVLAVFFGLLAFSGAWFPIADMPDFLQTLVRSLPATYAITTLRAAWMGTSLFVGHYFIAMIAAIVIFGLLSVKFFKYE